MIIRTRAGDIKNIIAAIVWNDYANASRIVIAFEKDENGNLLKRHIPVSPVNDIEGIFEDEETAAMFSFGGVGSRR